jgi:hypothetical protein
VEDIDYTMQGVLQTLIHPENYCESEQSRTAWIQALYRVARLANNFGSRALREQLLHLSSRFTCVDRLEAMPAALFATIEISLDDFSSTSRDELRAVLDSIRNTELNPEFLEFIESCYLVSLIVNPTEIEDRDVEVIARYRGEFSHVNLWLESLLIRELYPE